jgi:hypothetical protein
MEQVTSLKEMHDKLNEEKKQLRVKIRECRDALQKWEKDLNDQNLHEIASIYQIPET